MGWGVGVEDVQAESKVEPRLPRRWHLCGWKDDAGSRDLSSNLQSRQHACSASLGVVIWEAELTTQDFMMYLLPVKHSTPGLVPNPQLAKCCPYYDKVGGWCERQGALMSRGPNARSVPGPETSVQPAPTMDPPAGSGCELCP